MAAYPLSAAVRSTCYDIVTQGAELCQKGDPRRGPLPLPPISLIRFFPERGPQHYEVLAERKRLLLPLLEHNAETTGAQVSRLLSLLHNKLNDSLPKCFRRPNSET
jgi:hypothetical protein